MTRIRNITIAISAIAAAASGGIQAQAANKITFGVNNSSCGATVMCSTDGTHGYTTDGTGQAFNLSALSQWFQIDVNGSSELSGQPAEPDLGNGSFRVLNDTGSAITSFSLTITDDFTAQTPSVHACTGVQSGQICDNFSVKGGTGTYKFGSELSGPDWDRCTQGAQNGQTCTGGNSEVGADFAPNAVTYSWSAQNGSNIPAGAYFLINFSGWNNDGWAYQAPPPPAPKAYIANVQDNTVSVVDTSTEAVVATIPVGNGPSGVAATTDGSKVYVVNENSGNVSVIDTSSYTVVATIAVTGAFGIAISPDGSRLYVGTAYSGGNYVDVIDTATNTITGTITVGYSPYGIAISPDGAELYAVINGYNSGTASYLAVINTATETVTNTVPLEAYPWGVAVSPDGSRVYVANVNSSDVSVIDTSSDTVLTSVPVGFEPYAMVVTPDNSKVYVSNNGAGANSVSVIATSSDTVTATIPVVGCPYGVDVTPDGSRIYVDNLCNGSPPPVSVIDTTTNTVIANVSAGYVPYSFGRFMSP